jgi:hypothetical protein
MILILLSSHLPKRNSLKLKRPKPKVTLLKNDPILWYPLQKELKYLPKCSKLFIRLEKEVLGRYGKLSTKRINKSLP